MSLLGDNGSPPCRDLPSAKWSGAPQGYANSHHNSCSMRRNKCMGGCWSWHPESRNMARSMPRSAHRWPPKSCRKAPPTSLPCLFEHIWLHETLPTHCALIRRRSQTSRSQRRPLCLIGTKPYVSGSCFFHWQIAYWKDSKPWRTWTTGAANPWRLWTQRLDLQMLPDSSDSSQFNPLNFINKINHHESTCFFGQLQQVKLRKTMGKLNMWAFFQSFHRGNAAMTLAFSCRIRSNKAKHSGQRPASMQAYLDVCI